MMNFDTLSGYQFEEFTSKLLTAMGFDVEQTALSGDGGIDLLAYSNEPMFKGKYLVQCKHWKNSVGEPCIRDLYGVVLSENANKGILITTSFFTSKAREFAANKNIELIDGNNLNDLVNKYLNQYSNSSENIVSFLQNPDFEKEKYEILKNMVNNKDYETWKQLHDFLYYYIKNKKTNLMYTGLIEKCIEVSNEIKDKFGKRGNTGKAINISYSHTDAFLYFLLGRFDLCLDALVRNKVPFFTDMLSDLTHLIPEKEEIMSSADFILANVIVVLTYFKLTDVLQQLILLLKDRSTKYSNLYSFMHWDKNECNNNILRLEKQMNEINIDANKKIYIPFNNNPSVNNISGSIFINGDVDYDSNIYFTLEELKPFFKKIDNLPEQEKRIKLILELKSESKI